MLNDKYRQKPSMNQSILDENNKLTRKKVRLNTLRIDLQNLLQLKQSRKSFTDGQSSCIFQILTKTLLLQGKIHFEWTKDIFKSVISLDDKKASRCNDSDLPRDRLISIIDGSERDRFRSEVRCSTKKTLEDERNDERRVR